MSFMVGDQLEGGGVGRLLVGCDAAWRCSLVMGEMMMEDLDGI